MTPPAARAAHWVVTYQTTGLDTGTDSSGNPVSHAWTPTGDGGGYSPWRGGSSHGTVTPVLTWTLDSGETILPPAPDPAQAAVNVSINTSIDGNDGRGISPQHTSASDSFGDSFTTATSGNVQGTFGIFSHLAQAGNAGGSTQVSLPPITLDAACSTDGPNRGGSTSLSVVTTPLHIALGGTTAANGQYNILIGQGCTGSWVIGQSGRTYVTLSNYHWTIPGTVFDSFVVADNASYGYVHNIFGDEYEKPNPHWHWSKDETVTVSCTAQASFNGQVFGTVTGQQQVQVWAPYYYFGNDTGGVFIDPLSNSPGNYRLAARNMPNVSVRGSNWQGTVTIPSLFSSSGNGAWRYLQIITPGRKKTLFNGDPDNCTENGNTGLDTSYPYPADSNPADSLYDPFTVASAGGSTNDAWLDDDSLHQTGDSPRTILTDTIYSANIDESFQVYMMYLPPGSDSQWVPLHKFAWRWYADDTIPLPDGSWLSWPSGQSAGYVARSSSNRCYDHPFWQKLEGVSVGSGW